MLFGFPYDVDLSKFSGLPEKISELSFLLVRLSPGLNPIRKNLITEKFSENTENFKPTIFSERSENYLADVLAQVTKLMSEVFYENSVGNIGLQFLPYKNLPRVQRIFLFFCWED